MSSQLLLISYFKGDDMRAIFPRLCLALSLTATVLPVLADVVIVVNPKNPVANMTPEQVAQYFLGKSTTFTPVKTNFDQIAFTCEGSLSATFL